MKLTIAVPSKGRISDPAVNILEKAGLGLKRKKPDWDLKMRPIENCSLPLTTRT